MSRFACHLFVCTNERKPGDPRGSCSTRGSAALLEALKSQAHAAGLKGQVRVNKAGCLDACADGASVVAYLREPGATGRDAAYRAVWYAGVTAADADEIVARTLARGEVVERLRAPGTGAAEAH